MKKIIGLAVVAIIILASVGFGTWSYFSDTETANGNAVSAGTLTLSINGGYTNQTILTGLTNQVPGASGALYATLVNTGSIPGLFGVQTSTITNTQNNSIPKYGVGGLGATALGSVATVALWVDMNNNGTYDNGTDLMLKSDGTVVTTGLVYDTFNNYASKTWSTVIASMAATTSVRFYMSWTIPSSADNGIQGASTQVSLTFTLQQIH